MHASIFIEIYCTLTLICNLQAGNRDGDVPLTQNIPIAIKMTSRKSPALANGLGYSYLLAQSLFVDKGCSGESRR